MIQSLDRAMTILSILEQKNTASVTEIAEELGVNKKHCLPVNGDSEKT